MFHFQAFRDQRFFLLILLLLLLLLDYLTFVAVAFYFHFIFRKLHATQGNSVIIRVIIIIARLIIYLFIFAFCRRLSTAMPKVLRRAPIFYLNSRKNSCVFLFFFFSLSLSLFLFFQHTLWNCVFCGAYWWSCHQGVSEHEPCLEHIFLNISRALFKTLPVIALLVDLLRFLSFVYYTFAQKDF